MALALYDRVRETTTVLGTNDAILLGAVTGFQSFAAVGNGNTCYYTIADQLGNWEVGLGTYSTTGPTLARTTVYASSNSGSKVAFPAGTKDIFLTYVAEKAVQLDASGNVSPLGTIASGTWQASTITTAYGGTGLASFTAGDLPYYSTGTALSKLGIGTSGQILTSSGTAPQWSTLSGVAVTTISFDTTGLTPATATSGAVTVGGTLITSNGGTGLSSYTAGDTLYYASGTTLTKVGIGAANTVYTSSGTAPQWSTSLNLAGSLTAAADSSFTSTGALLISKGTTGQQPGSPAVGMMRYNTTTNQFEGYSGSSPAWKSIGGSALSNDTTTASNLYPVFAAATTGTAENLYTSNANYLYKPSTGELQALEVVATNGLIVNSQTVSVSYSIPSGSNAISAGPVSIASGITVTVPSGSVWVVA